MESRAQCMCWKDQLSGYVHFQRVAKRAEKIIQIPDYSETLMKCIGHHPAISFIHFPLVILLIAMHIASAKVKYLSMVQKIWRR